MPTLTDIHSWHGFVNQLAPFLATAPVMEPFQKLLRKPQDKKVYWDESLLEKFWQAKEIVCRLAESGYAPVQGKALAITWCLRKASQFLLGCPNLIIVTDHRPLMKLLGDRELKDIGNPRLFALKEKTLQYRFQIKYLPWKRNSAADFLSRYPALREPPDAEDEEQASDVELVVVAATVAVLENDENIIMDSMTMVKAATEDPDYQLLITKVTEGDWHPHRAQELTCLRQFSPVLSLLGCARVSLN
ncbi:uncharacterized protein LOC135116054 [Scylla paramamosain]|uniref:uncharacterized protein LOC135116054 n=1 Tax=Scylla paramamosain TaxID=85552 RepID=UPI003083311D